MFLPGTKWLIAEHRKCIAEFKMLKALIADLAKYIGKYLNTFWIFHVACLFLVLLKTKRWQQIINYLSRIQTHDLFDHVCLYH